MKRLTLIIALLCTFIALPTHAVKLKIATFQVDATPPHGSPLCAGSIKPVESVDDPLSARGIIYFPEGQDPLVVIVVDWVGIANGTHTVWRQALAEAVGTPIDRVAVHTIHQHDAPFADFTTEALMIKQGLEETMFDTAFTHDVIQRSAVAAKKSLRHKKRVTHIGLGKSKVDRVASNRRILGEDGKVRAVRWTTCTDPELRAEPEGTIDPWMRAVSFWVGNKPVLIMTHYATHPQSYYGNGQVSADFPGLARAQREAELPNTKHFHFNGAGGNIGAGKYNDGDHKNRAILAGRMRDGMQAAFDNSEKYALKDLGFDWTTEPVNMPLREDISREWEQANLTNKEISDGARAGSAREIAWIDRVNSKTNPIHIGRLRIGTMQLIYMPGELFVEYQLAAQEMAPNDFVAMAAYGDYGPGYIGMARHYPEGGYETGKHVSRTAPEVEQVLLGATETLLKR
jgi:hypothetical protein